MAKNANIRFENANVAYVAVDPDTHEMTGGVMDETTGIFYPVGGGGGVTLYPVTVKFVFSGITPSTNMQVYYIDESGVGVQKAFKTNTTIVAYTAVKTSLSKVSSIPALFQFGGNAEYDNYTRTLTSNSNSSVALSIYRGSNPRQGIMFFTNLPEADFENFEITVTLS